MQVLDMWCKGYWKFIKYTIYWSNGSIWQYDTRESLMKEQTFWLWGRVSKFIANLLSRYKNTSRCLWQFVCFPRQFLFEIIWYYLFINLNFWSHLNIWPLPWCNSRFYFILQVNSFLLKLTPYYSHKSTNLKSAIICISWQDLLQFLKPKLSHAEAKAFFNYRYLEFIKKAK